MTQFDQNANDYETSAPGRQTTVVLRGRNATLLLVSALTVMSGATIAPSLPALEAHFAGVEDVGLLTRLVLTVPALFIAVCAPFAGMVADRFGRRRLLFASLLLYTVAGMSGLVLDSLPGILAGRALLGMAVAGTMTVATALIGDYFSGAERVRFMGLQAACIGFSGLVFLTGGGLLAELHWRAPFGVYGLALLLLPAAFAFIHEPVHAATLNPDGTQRANDEAGSGFAIAAVFAAAVLNSLIFYLMPTQLPFYLQTMGDDAPVMTGMALGTMTLASALTSLFGYARIRARLGIVGVFAAGFGLMALANLLTAGADSYPVVVIALAVLGLGMGLIMPNLTTASMQAAPSRMRGRVAGGLTASIFIGQFASPFISQPLIARYGYESLYLVAGATLALACVVILAAQRYRQAGKEYVT